MAKTTPLEQLNKAITQILQEYSDDVSANLDTMVQKVCQKGTKALKAEAAKAQEGKEYPKSWTSTVERQRLYSNGIIYSRTPGLPHLLEYGHVIRSGGRITGQAKAHTHIAAVAEKLVNEFEREVERKL